MKKKVLIFIILFMSCAFVSAGDFSFVFADLDQHTELLSGFLPTLLEVGVSYDGFKFKDDESTSIRLTAGGGIIQRDIFQDPLTGEPINDKIHIYDVLQIRWNLRLTQTFLKDLSLSLGYSGKWEKSQDSMLISGGGFPKPSDISRKRGLSGSTDLVTFDDWFNNEMNGKTSRNTTPIYPDLHDESNVINTAYLNIKYDRMEDTGVANSGWYAELKAEYAPSFLNKNSTFIGFIVNAVKAETLYQLTSDRGNNLFSVVLIDRINASFATGSAVPVGSQSPYSLGRKIRGFNSRSYNSNFSIVNNLELRLSGPEFPVKQIFPRMNIFLDIGYGGGNYFNTGYNEVKAVKADNFLASTGVQLEFDFFDMIDLGLEVAYLLNGTNIRNPSSKVQMGATFFLDF